MDVNHRLQERELTETERAHHLAHVESQLCWCDPMIERDEHDRKVIVHIEVTWQ
jgi:hypothetical protein